MRKKDKKAIIALCLAAASCAVLAGCGAKKEETGLLTPQNLVLSDTEILCWDKVKNADFYRVSVNDVEYITEETEYDLFEVLNQYDVKYEVKVMAGKIGKEYEYSDWTAPIEYALENFEVEWMLTEDGEGVRILHLLNKTNIKGKVLMPAEIEGKPVTTINPSVFSGCTGITGVYLPDSATNLVGGNFNGCTNLKRVRFSPHTTKLPSRALRETGIEQITLPEGLESIEDYAFDGSALKEITLPKSLKTLGKYAFQNSNLRRLEIPWGVTKIGDSFCANCKNLTEVILPDFLTEIGREAFAGCEKLEKISIPDKVTVIQSQTFANCRSLQEIKLPSALKELGQGAFRNCAVLKEVSLPNALRKLGKGVFYGCASLQEIEIPRDVEMLVTYESFADDPLESMFVSGGLFWGCVNLKSVRVAEGNLTFRSEGNCIIRRADETVLAGCDYSDIPDGVKSIAKAAFGMLKRKELYIPASVENVVEGAFHIYPNLESITVADENPYFTDEGNALIRISDKCLLLGCSTTQIPSDIKTIGEGAFMYVSIENIVLPNSVEKIYAFAFAECPLTSIVLSENLQVIVRYAFYSCTNLKEIAFPEGLRTIGDYAFYSCTSLEVIDLPSSLRSLKRGQFGDCKNLKKVFWYEKKLEYSTGGFVGSNPEFIFKSNNVEMM